MLRSEWIRFGIKFIRFVEQDAFNSCQYFKLVLLGFFSLSWFLFKRKETPLSQPWCSLRVTFQSPLSISCIRLVCESLSGFVLLQPHKHRCRTSEESLQVPWLVKKRFWVGFTVAISDSFSLLPRAFISSKALWVCSSSAELLSSLYGQAFLLSCLKAPHRLALHEGQVFSNHLICLLYQVEVSTELYDLFCPSWHLSRLSDRSVFDFESQDNVKGTEEKLHYLLLLIYKSLAEPSALQTFCSPSTLNCFVSE